MLILYYTFIFKSDDDDDDDDDDDIMNFQKQNCHQSQQQNFQMNQSKEKASISSDVSPSCFFTYLSKVEQPRFGGLDSDLTGDVSSPVSDLAAKANAFCKIGFSIR